MSLYLLVAALGVQFHHIQGVSGSCPPLPVPSFGQILYNGTDVTQSQPQIYSVNATVEYQCAIGYQLILFNSKNVLEQKIATCVANASWSLLDVTCQLMSSTAGPLPENDDLNLLVSARDALIIVGAVLGALVILLLLLVLCCCCWTIQLRSHLRIRQHSEALIRSSSQAEGLVLPNPIIEIKEPEDDSSGNPLYLTPTEMNKFDTGKQQLGKHTRL